MNSLIFNFYRILDLIAADGKSLDLCKLSRLAPIASLKARPRAVLRMHLEHLAFEISKQRPDLEGKTLNVELNFEGMVGVPMIPVLAALHDRKRIATKRVLLQNLDTAPFDAMVRKRHPELKHVDLVFALKQPDESHMP
jgi:hypothetical protein